MTQRISLLIAMLCVAILSSAQTQTSPQGQGTENDPYKISSIENLYWLGMNVNYWNTTMEGKYFVQTQDIDASATADASYHSGNGWEPIGDSTGLHFKGHYDGQGYTIDGLTLNRTTRNCAGLFGYIEGGSISNLGMTNVNIRALNAVAALVGYSEGVIENCYATGAVSGAKYAGGLVGVNADSLRNSYSECIVAGNEESGGFVGVNLAQINLCFSAGTAVGTKRIGGFIGSNGGNIYNCYSHALVSRLASTDESFGGFAGYTEGGRIYYCYITGAVNYENGIIPSTNGFIGERKSGYSNGILLDTVTSLQTSTANCYMATTEVMTSGTIYYNRGYDFKGRGNDEIWNIGNGRNSGYPYFCWQYPTDAIPILNLKANVQTTNVTYNGGTSIDITAKVTDMGSPIATDHGFCWGTDIDPEITNSREAFGAVTDTDPFSYTITGLSLDTDYFLRSYAINAVDTVYSPSIKINTYGIPDGTGTEQDPYIIASLTHLKWINNQSLLADNSFKGIFLRQVADIDASETVSWNSGSGWKPVGDGSPAFMGNYDGGGHTIDGIYINYPTIARTGFFGTLTDATIADLSITNVNITGKSYVGGFTGTARHSTISNCMVTGSVTATDKYCGGFIGLCSNSASNMVTIANCGFEGSVLGTENVGGFIGEHGQDTYTKRCFSTGDVSGWNNVGGFTGVARAEITDCYTRANITRIAGEETTFGGFLGYPYYGTLINCFATGSIDYTGSENPTNCGFEGEKVWTEQNVISSFWDMESSMQTDGYTTKAEGKSSADMKTMETFSNAGWNFKFTGSPGTWNIGNGRNDGYPYLSWQYPQDDLGTTQVEPAISAINLTKMTTTSADFSSYVSSIGIPAATESGLCWSTTKAPTTADNTKLFGTIANADSAKTQITGLSSETTYYVRPYIINANGTFYGHEYTFITSKTPQGDGSQGSPFLIGSLSDLYWLAYQRNIIGNTFDNLYTTQTADIDMAETAHWNDGEGWLPIDVFQGHYNGGGYTIDGLYINRPKLDYVGLWAQSSFDCIYTDIVVTNAHVTGMKYVGVIFGGVWYSEIKRCFSSGTVHGNAHVGGLTGEIHETNLSWCGTEASVDANYWAGGFAGRCFNTGRTITDCFARGNVSRIYGNDSVFGGFIGNHNGPINNCYSTGKVIYLNGTSPTDKGFIGEIYSTATGSENFWDTDASLQTTSASNIATGMPTSMMKDGFFFRSAGWDFDGMNPGPEYWKIDPVKNGGYPYFSWQKFPQTPTIKTKTTSNPTATEVTLNGQISDLGLNSPTAHGFCWGNDPMPNLTSGSVHDLGATSAIGAFQYTIPATEQCKVYYYRAFATNTEGTAYGTEETYSQDKVAPLASWDLPNPVIIADPATGKGTMPDYTSMLTISDACGADNVTVKQSFTPGSTVSAGTTFLVQFTVKDAAGNQTTVQVYGSVETQPIQEIALVNGWNLVALYMTADDMTIQSVFPNAVSVKSADEFWNASQPAYLNSLTSIVAGNGYLVNNSANEAITIQGTIATTAQFSPTLHEGWNLVGIATESDVDRTSLSIPNLEAIKDFDEYYIQSGDLGDLDVLKTGSAYFIKIGK